MKYSGYIFWLVRARSKYISNLNSECLITENPMTCKVFQEGGASSPSGKAINGALLYMGLRVFDFFKPSCHFFSVDVEHCEIGQVQYPQIMSLVSWKYLNVYGSWDSTSPPLHSFFSRQLVSTRYL